MMVGIIPVLVVPVFGHELHKLQDAVVAIDIRHPDICFPERVRRRLLRMGEQAIGENGRRCVGDFRGYRPGTLWRIARGDFGVGRQFRRRPGQCNPVVARMENRFPQFDMEQVATPNLVHAASWRAGIGGCAAAGRKLLRIAKPVLDQRG